MNRFSRLFCVCMLCGLWSCAGGEQPLPEASTEPDAARDAGEEEAGGEAGAEADGEPWGIQPTTTPDNFGCRLSTPLQSGELLRTGWWWICVGGVLLGGGKRLRRRTRLYGKKYGLPLLMLCGMLLCPLPAEAQAGVDQDEMEERLGFEEPHPFRHGSVSWNPFSLHLSRASLTLEAVPVPHHAIVVSPFFASTTTNSDSYNNVFRGYGGEVGYRYYTQKHGPEGVYVGPSLLVGHYLAIPQRGVTQAYWNFGAALDVGVQALVATRWVVGLGAGVQYNGPTVLFPPQELPASVYAQSGFRVRLLCSLGVSF